MENYHGQPIFLTEALTQEALKAVATATETKKPFFLYFSLYGVHTPLMADARFIDRYTALDLPQHEAKYASMIESMDHALGELLDYLDQRFPPIGPIPKAQSTSTAPMPRRSRGCPGSAPRSLAPSSTSGSGQDPSKASTTSTGCPGSARCASTRCATWSRRDRLVRTGARPSGPRR